VNWGYLTAVRVLADDGPRNPGPDFGKASPFGLLVVVLLLIATFTLVWSMNRHLRKLPESFDPEHPEPDQALDDGTVVIEAPEESGASNGVPREPGG
jgi:hypothetical protein